MKAASNKGRWLKLTGILLGLSFCFQVQAFARSYGESYNLLEWVDEMNEAQAIGCAVTVATPAISQAIAPAVSNIASSVATDGIVNTAIQGAIHGAVIGGIGDLASGGDGSGALYGAASGAVFGGLTGKTPGAVKNDNYLLDVRNSLLTSEIAKGATAVAINEWGMDRQEAQWLGMTASGTMGMAMSQAQMERQPAQGQSATQQPKMDFIESMGMAATQAAIHVGVESEFKDKAWAPAVASFAGQAGGSLAFDQVAGSLTGKDYIPDDENFVRGVMLDAVDTGIQVAALDADKPQQRAQLLGTMGRMLVDDFVMDNLPRDDKTKQGAHDFLTGNEVVDKLAKPAIYYGASMALNKIADQEKMDSTTFSQITAMNAASLQTVLGEEGAAERFLDQQNRVGDFNYDPTRFNGGSDNTGVYQASRANSQLWDSSGIGQLTHVSYQVKEKGGDWRDYHNRGVTRQTLFGSYGGRAGLVYDRAAVDDLTDTTYNVGYKVLPIDSAATANPKLDQIGERNFANDAQRAEFNSHFDKIDERIRSSSRAVSVIKGKQEEGTYAGRDFVSFGFPDGQAKFLQANDQEWHVLDTAATPVDSTTGARTVTTDLDAFKQTPTGQGLYLGYRETGGEYQQNSLGVIEGSVIQGEISRYKWDGNH